MDSNPRHECLIEGCRRTKQNDDGYDEWICQKHWSVVPKKYRRLYAMAKRKFKKGHIDYERVQAIWVRCKDQAYKNAWTV